MKVPALEAPAPTQSEPPFLGTQVVMMLVSIVLGILAAKGFSGGRPSTLSERAEPFGTIFVSSVSGVASSYSNQSEADSENLFSGEGSGCRRGA